MGATLSSCWCWALWRPEVLASALGAGWLGAGISVTTEEAMMVLTEARRAARTRSCKTLHPASDRPSFSVMRSPSLRPGQGKRDCTSRLAAVCVLRLARDSPAVGENDSQDDAEAVWQGAAGAERAMQDVQAESWPERQSCDCRAHRGELQRCRQRDLAASQTHLDHPSAALSRLSSSSGACSSSRWRLWASACSSE